MECLGTHSADALKSVVIALEIASWILGWPQISMWFFNIPHKIHSPVTVLLHYGDIVGVPIGIGHSCILLITGVYYRENLKLLL